MLGSYSVENADTEKVSQVDSEQFVRQVSIARWKQTSLFYNKKYITSWFSVLNPFTGDGGMLLQPTI